jgi:hypothetical protein
MQPAESGADVSIGIAQQHREPDQNHMLRDRPASKLPAAVFSTLGVLGTCLQRARFFSSGKGWSWNQRTPSLTCHNNFAALPSFHQQLFTCMFATKQMLTAHFCPSLANLQHIHTALLMDTNQQCSLSHINIGQRSSEVVSSRDALNLGLGSTGSTPFRARAAALKYPVTLKLLKFTF